MQFCMQKFFFLAGFRGPVLLQADKAGGESATTSSAGHRMSKANEWDFSVHSVWT